jgi:hypothetical protein
VPIRALARRRRVEGSGVGDFWAPEFEKPEVE